MFQGRKLLVATKHKKEEVIAPILEKEFGVQCYTSNSFDTDLLGTFSGEVPRKEDALTTLRTKCFLSLDSTDCDLVVASEGSFGSHPVIFFAQANEEIYVKTKGEFLIPTFYFSSDKVYLSIDGYTQIKPTTNTLCLGYAIQNNKIYIDISDITII